jgi:CRP-like cAMP-binding protein
MFGRVSGQAPDGRRQGVLVACVALQSVNQSSMRQSRRPGNLIIPERPMTVLAPQNPDSLRASLIAKLGRFIELTPQEIAYIEAMQVDFLTIPAGIDIVRAGQTYRCIYVLCQGMAIRYKILSDGRRQVLSLILPGDFAGLPGGLFERSLYSVSGLTRTVACPLAYEAVFKLFRRQPRLAAALFWMVEHDAALFAEHLVGIGRQSAYERVARLLLELLFRMRMAGLADERSYCLPLTQELIADTLGLSVPHVNRTLRRLREDGMILLEGSRLTCLDVPALSCLADFDGVNFCRKRVPGL